MDVQPFDDSYFEHYAYFDNNKTPYDNAFIRFMGNVNLPKTMLKLYWHLFKRAPKNYVDLGCGTGEEMAEYNRRGIEVSGCDFSKYVLERKNKEIADKIEETDSISFIKHYQSRIDVLFDSTLQYLDDKNFAILMNEIQHRVSEECVFGVLYDDTERNHPYRSQVHPCSWWIKTMEGYGFEQSETYLQQLIPDRLSKRMFKVTKDLIFIKRK